MLIGADPEELDKLADTLKLGAKQMGTSANHVTTSLSRVRWEGRDASDFRRRWTSTHRPLLGRVADEIEAMSRLLVQEARDQREASGEGGVVAAGGVAAAAIGAAAAGAVGGVEGGGSNGGGGSTDPVTGAVTVTHTSVDNTHAEVSGSKEWGKDPNDPDDAGKPSTDEKPSRTKVSGEVSTEVASDHREKIIGPHGEKTGEHHGAVDAKGTIEGTAGIKATNDASLKVGADGVTASSEGRVVAGLDGSVRGEVGKGPVKVSGGATGMAGAEASYDGKLKVGPQGVSAEAGVGGFAGIRAGVDGSVDVAGVKAGGGASAEFGVGAGAKGGIDFNTHKIGIKGDAHLALGLGVELKIDVSVDPTKVVKNAGKAVDFAGDRAGDAKDLVSGASKHVTKHLPPIKKFW